MTESDDAELMARTAAGDMEAFGELIERHQAKVLAVALRTLGNRDLAEDVAQDVFVKAYHAAKRYKPSARFTTWLYRVAVNRCLDVMRRDKAAPVSLEVVGDLGGEVIEAGGMERAETAARVRRAIAALGPRQRLALVLHRYQELSVRRIAEATGWSSSAVESLLVRAYARLREALSDLVEP